MHVYAVLFPYDFIHQNISKKNLNVQVAVKKSINNHIFCKNTVFKLIIITFRKHIGKLTNTKIDR